jgi:hypothetical protein
MQRQLLIQQVDEQRAKLAALDRQKARQTKWRRSLMIEGLAAAIALDIHLQDCGVMDEAIDGRERHSLVGEDPGPGGPPNGLGPTRRGISGYSGHKAKAPAPGKCL